MKYELKVTNWTMTYIFSNQINTNIIFRYQDHIYFHCNHKLSKRNIFLFILFCLQNQLGMEVGIFFINMLVMKERLFMVFKTLGLENIRHYEVKIWKQMYKCEGFSFN